MIKKYLSKYLTRKIKEHFKKLEENIEGDPASVGELNLRLRKLEMELTVLSDFFPLYLSLS